MSRNKKSRPSPRPPPSPPRSAAAGPELVMARTAETTRAHGEGPPEKSGIGPLSVAPRPAPAPLRSAAAPLGAADPGRSALWLVLVVVAFVALAGGVLALTRRRARRQSLIQILQTAAIGPKRALRGAGERTDHGAGGQRGGDRSAGAAGRRIEPPVAAVMGSPPALGGGPDELALASRRGRARARGGSRPLSRLFRLRPQESSARDAAAFRELLDESYEDQELRDKLAQGLSGKVS